MTNEELIEEIKFFISFLYLKHPFYNAIISTIDIELETTEESEKYGIYSKNNDSIFIDYEFAKKEIKKNKKVFFYYIIHEILHILLKHKIRGFGRHEKKWAKATDMSIDAVIAKDKVLNNLIQTPDSASGKNVVYDTSDSVSATAEDFYRTIKIREDDTEDKQKEKQKGECKSGSCSNGGKKQNKKSQKGHLNNHKSWELKEKDITKEENKINEKLVKAYQFVSMKKQGNKEYGGVPGEFMEMLEEFLQPKTNLLDFINKSVQNFKHYRPTYKRGDRRYLHKGLIVPSKVLDVKHFELLFYIDTSGSVSTKELLKSISEIYHVINSLKSYKIDIIQSDAGISDIYTITNKTGIDLDKLKTVKGRGGTEMEPLFKHLKDNSYDIVLVSSDYHISKQELNGLINLNKEFKTGFIATENSNKENKKQLSPLFQL